MPWITLHSEVHVETKNYLHTTVLLNEAVDALLEARVAMDPVFVDGTFGRGGHSRLVLSKLPAEGRLIAFDKDVEAIADARRKTIPAQRFGTPQEFGAICAFLCSVHAGYITGQNVLADGGAYPGTF